MAIDAERRVPEPRQLNLGCGTDRRMDAHNVDVDGGVQPDQVVDLDGVPWPWPDNTFEHVLASHVFEHLTNSDAAMQESARILQPGGRLDVRMPIGLDMRADRDHNPRSEWTWQTPEYYTDSGTRHWDLDTGLRIVKRDVSLWAQLPGRWCDIQQAVLDRLLNAHGPGRWCFGLPAVSGEYQVVFRQ